MDESTHERRQFLQRLVALMGVAWVSTALPPAPTRFNVAGVRFNHSRRTLQLGEAVTLVKAEFKNATCFEVISSDGEKIGYVPRHLVPRFSAAARHRALVKSVNHGAVPWKRYLIETTIADS